MQFCGPLNVYVLHNLADYEKRLDIPGLGNKSRRIFFFIHCIKKKKIKKQNYSFSFFYFQLLGPLRQVKEFYFLFLYLSSLLGGKQQRC